MTKQESYSKEPKQIIIIRTDTNPKMRKGKMIAQGAHASMKVIFDMMDTFEAISTTNDLTVNKLTIIKGGAIDLYFSVPTYCCLICFCIYYRWWC